MNKTLIFDVSTLLSKETGVTEVYSFNGPVKFEDIELEPNLSGKVEIMRIDDGFNVVVKGASASLRLLCEKCLEDFTAKIKVDSAERQFLLKKPKILDDPNDFYPVDKKHLTLDLTEMLRQEIILHSPTTQVCSTRCKGICPHCGKNRNKEKCKCKITEKPLTTTKPLAELKKLLK